MQHYIHKSNWLTTLYFVSISVVILRKKIGLRHNCSLIERFQVFLFMECTVHNVYYTSVPDDVNNCYTLKFLHSLMLYVSQIFVIQSINEHLI